MRPGPVVRLAWHNLRRAPVRSSLSAMAVAFGVATLVAADVVSRSVTSEIDRSAEAITAFMSEQLNVGMTVVGLVVVVGAGFLTFNTFAMAVAQRRSDLGRLRAAGMARRQVLGMILTEAGLLGVAGSVVGAAGGALLGRGLIDLVKSASEMFNRFGEVTASPARMGWAMGLGIAVALAAAWIPARRAVRVSPLAAVRLPASDGPARVPTAPAIVGGALVIGLWTTLALTTPGAWIQPPWSTVLSAALGGLWLAALALAVPWLIHAWARLLRPLLGRMLGPAGRQAADNLRRRRAHAGFTVATLAVGVGMIVGVTGYMTFWFEEIFFRTSDTALRTRPAIGLFPIHVEAGLEAYAGLSSLALPPGLLREVEAVVGDRGVPLETYFVLAPELAFMGERYFSFVLDPTVVRETGDLMFSFAAGNWDRALELARGGCVVFVTPSVARRNAVWVEDSLTLTTPTGPLRCTVAGVGPTFVGASIISREAQAAYGLTAPIGLTVFARTPDEHAGLMRDLTTLAARHSGVWPLDITRMTEIQRDGMQSIQIVMNAMLVLAVLSAGLGVVNTTVVGLTERRREFGILRAAGATRSHVRLVVVVEGLLFGFLGAALGLLGGAGVVMIYAVVSGGSAMGFPDFPVWAAAWGSVIPGLRTGVVALLLTPLLTALVAAVPARRLLRGTVTESLAEGGRGW